VKPILDSRQISDRSAVRFNMAKGITQMMLGSIATVIFLIFSIVFFTNIEEWYYWLFGLFFPLLTLITIVIPINDLKNYRAAKKRKEEANIFRTI